MIPVARDATTFKNFYWFAHFKVINTTMTPKRFWSNKIFGSNQYGFAAHTGILSFTFEQKASMQNPHVVNLSLVRHLYQLKPNQTKMAKKQQQKFKKLKIWLVV